MQLSFRSSSSAVQRVRLPRGILSKLAIGAFIVFIGLFLGVLSVFLPWVISVGFGLAVVFPVVLWNFPWVGVALTLSVVFIAPDVKWADLATGVALVIYLAKYVLDGGRGLRLQEKRLSGLFVIWLGVIALSVLAGYFYFGNSISYIYRDSRPFLYWLWVPVIAWLLEKEDWRLDRLKSLFVFLGVLIASVALVQWVFGIQIVTSGRVGALETGGAYNVGETRVQMHGYVFVMGVFIWAICSLVLNPRGFALFLPLLLVSGLAIYVNYGRALWFWTAVAVFLAAFYLPKKRIFILSLFAFPFLVIAFGAVNKYAPQKVDAAVERMLSVQDEGGERSSYGLRRLENRQALQQIYSNPLFGVGLGGEYRGWLSEIRNFEEHTRYVHNGYIFIALKTGVVSLALMCGFLALVWLKSARSFSARAGDPQSPFVIASIACFPACAGLSMTQPEIANPYGVFFLAVIVLSMYSVGMRKEEAKNC